MVFIRFPMVLTTNYRVSQVDFPITLSRSEHLESWIRAKTPAGNSWLKWQIFHCWISLPEDTLKKNQIASGCFVSHKSLCNLPNILNYRVWAMLGFASRRKNRWVLAVEIRTFCSVCVIDQQSMAFLIMVYFSNKITFWKTFCLQHGSIVGVGSNLGYQLKTSGKPKEFVFCLSFLYHSFS